MNADSLQDITENEYVLDNAEIVNTPAHSPDQCNSAVSETLKESFSDLKGQHSALLDQFVNIKTKYETLIHTCRCKDVIEKKDVSTNASLSIQYNPIRFSIDIFKNNDNEISYYTGFPNYDIFKISLNMLFEYNVTSLLHHDQTSHSKRHSRTLTLSTEDEYFLVLIKLRQNFGYHHLSTLFQISISTVSKIFTNWINFIYQKLGSRDIWPHRNVLISHYSDAFLKSYSTVIGFLDATELFMQTPSSLLRQSQTFSHYKNYNTLKGLVAVDANGAIIFCSALFTGSISDNKLLEISGFTKTVQSKLEKGLLQPGDTFFADKGFTTTNQLEPLKIVTPVFRNQNIQFSANEVLTTQYIARERVHVERAIGRIKQYKILASTIPIALTGTINQIWTVCCLLSNFQLPLRVMETDTGTV